jgi:hypothetical protein
MLAFLRGEMDNITIFSQQVSETHEKVSAEKGNKLEECKTHLKKLHKEHYTFREKSSEIVESLKKEMIEIENEIADLKWLNVEKLLQEDGIDILAGLIRALIETGEQTMSAKDILDGVKKLIESQTRKIVI